jgi:hypothetical protein
VFAGKIAQAHRFTGAIRAANGGGFEIGRRIAHFEFGVHRVFNLVAGLRNIAFFAAMAGKKQQLAAHSSKSASFLLVKGMSLTMIWPVHPRMVTLTSYPALAPGRLALGAPLC